MKLLQSLSSDWRTVLIAFLPMYLLANAYLHYLGEVTGVLLIFAYATYTVILSWLTWRVTHPLPTNEAPARHNKTALWAQVAVLLGVIVLTGLDATNIPLWSEMVAWFYNLGERFLPAEWFGGPGNAVANPVQYFVIPFLLLLVLGAKPTEFGLGKGHKVWQACLVWLALPVVLLLGTMVAGFITPQVLARRIIGNFFQNGFFEEFLMRGALQTRLQKLFSTPWALALQAVVFGLWHLRANTNMMDGNVLAGLAVCLISQTVAGLVYGYILHRTRNLVAPSIAHVAMNVLGQTF